MNRYFVIYKPFQVLTQFSDSAGKQTLKDHFDLPTDVYPVGRLDNDSEGLLIISNDKRLNHLLLDPSFAHPRTYWVQVEGTITDAALTRLEKGVDIGAGGEVHRTRPAIAATLENTSQIPPRNPPIRFRLSVPDSWISLTLTEGKNRQVRKMTAAVGFPTLRLIRFSIGKLTLGTMQPGDILELPAADLYRALSIPFK